jgi:uncharacterized protein (UPF0335 family)
MPDKSVPTDRQRAVIEAWFDHVRTGASGLEGAADEVTSWTFVLSAEHQWQLVLEMIRLAPDDQCLSAVAVGPLEGLLGAHGDQFIDRVEALAAENDRLARTLTDVWQHGMSDAVYQRIKAIQAGVKDPLQVAAADSEKAAEQLRDAVDRLETLMPDLQTITPEDSAGLAWVLEHLKKLRQDPPESGPG